LHIALVKYDRKEVVLSVIKTLMYFSRCIQYIDRNLHNVVMTLLWPLVMFANSDV